MFDIDAIKRYSAELKSSNDYAERIFDSMVRPLVVLDAELRVQHANPTFYETFNTTPNEANGHLLLEHFDGQLDKAELQAALKSALETDLSVRSEQIVVKVPERGMLTLHLNIARVQAAPDAQMPSGLLVSIDDITARIRAEAALRRNENLAAMGTLAAGSLMRSTIRSAPS
jgi:two-component system CheB/CheR fusion protein